MGIGLCLGNATDLFTGVMYNTYSPPPGFCFDLLCNDEPIVDDKKSPMYNVPERISKFFDYLDNVTKNYATNNVIITMGEDFNYQDAYAWFKNLDKLILYVSGFKKPLSNTALLSVTQTNNSNSVLNTI